MVISVLIVLAAACVVVAWLAGSSTFAYTALAMSTLGLVVLAMRMWQNMKAQTASDYSPVATGDGAKHIRDNIDGDRVAHVDSEQTEYPADSLTAVREDDVSHEDTAAVLAEDEDSGAQASSTAVPVEDTPTEVIVYVVPGRMRFHKAGCRLLQGHDYENLTLAEAREEIFTPCTRCMGSATKRTRKAS